MSDPENPTITCTQRELAWDAWQTAQGVAVMQSRKTSDTFERWWASVAHKMQSFIPSQRWSLRDLIEAAWRDARAVQGFEAYWANVVGA